MKILLWAGVAGFVGTILRYECVRNVNHLFPGFPWGTLAVNVIGSFATGFLFVLCREKFQHYEIYFPILFIGFLGGFTTFSAFSLESIRYFLAAQYGKFFWNVALQNVSGLLAAAGGIFLSRIILKATQF